MQKNFSESDLRQAAELANSDVGKQLMALLQGQHSHQMQQVFSSVKSGDLEQAKQSLAAFMADPKTAALLKKLQEDPYGRNGR